MKKSFLIMAISLFGFANVSVASPVENVEQEVVMVTPMANPMLSGFTGGFTASAALASFLVVMLNRRDPVLHSIEAEKFKEVVIAVLCAGVAGGVIGAANNFIWSRVWSSPKLVDKVKEEK